jgi:hypothetical protein
LSLLDGSSETKNRGKRQWPILSRIVVIHLITVADAICGRIREMARFL